MSQEKQISAFPYIYPSVDDSVKPWKTRGRGHPTKYQGDLTIMQTLEYLDTCTERYIAVTVKDENNKDVEDSRWSEDGMMVEEDDQNDAINIFNDAIDVVVDNGKASTSFLQRQLRIGYSKAARAMDDLEETGIISEQVGAKPRDVLIEKSEAAAYKRKEITTDLEIGGKVEPKKKIKVKTRTVYRPELPSIVGLALYLGVSSKTVYRWEEENPEYCPTLDLVRDAQHSKLINGGISGQYREKITSLLLGKDHGYAEKIDHTTKGEAITYGDDRLEEIYNARKNRS